MQLGSIDDGLAITRRLATGGHTMRPDHAATLIDQTVAIVFRSWPEMETALLDDRATVLAGGDRSTLVAHAREAHEQLLHVQEHGLPGHWPIPSGYRPAEPAPQPVSDLARVAARLQGLHGFDADEALRFAELLHDKGWPLDALAPGAARLQHQNGLDGRDAFHRAAELRNAGIDIGSFSNDMRSLQSVGVRASTAYTRALELRERGIDVTKVADGVALLRNQGFRTPEAYARAASLAGAGWSIPDTARGVAVLRAHHGVSPSLAYDAVVAATNRGTRVTDVDAEVIRLRLEHGMWPEDALEQALGLT